MAEWTSDATWYRERVRRHPQLWTTVRSLLSEHHVSKLLEIGGGLCSLADVVDDYIGIELNQAIADEVCKRKPKIHIINGDWLQLEVNEYRDQVDAVVALGVVEHCASYRDFIRKCLAVRPRLVLISFFHGLSDQPKDRIVVRKTDCTTTAVHNNTYSRPRLEHFLARYHKLINDFRLLPIVKANGKQEILLVIEPAQRSVRQRLTKHVGRGAQFMSVVLNTMVKLKGQLASEEVIAQRLAICERCSRFLPRENRCAVCGCRLGKDQGFRKNLANKLAHQSSVCPLKKWGKVQS